MQDLDAIYYFAIGHDNGHTSEYLLYVEDGRWQAVGFDPMGNLYIGEASTPSQLEGAYGECLGPNHCTLTLGICAECEGPIWTQDYICGRCRASGQI